jgi:hypothetical protein
MNRIYYNSARLTFKRDLIEALKPDDIFEVTVNNEGTYRITKRDFYRIFSNVTESKSYQVIGNYNYKKTPSKALQFKL